MKYRFLILILSVFFLFGSITCISQQETKIENAELAREQIKSLKNGVLLVRLFRKKQSIEALKEYNRFRDAEKLEKKLLEENLEIAYAFEENFDFCPVYFFYADHSPALLRRDWDSVVFMNYFLEPLDPQIKPENFLTAEFSTIKPDTAKYYTGTRLEPGANGLERKEMYGSKPDLGFSAIIMMDENLVQLKRPFPYYIRRYKKLLFFERAYSVAILMMNRDLHDFY